MALNRLAVLGIAVDPTKAVAGSRRATRAIAGVGRAASNVKNRIFSLQGALVALGGGLVVKSFLTTASSMENLKIQLKTVTGSANDADKAFARLTDFTTRTPYEIDQVVSAFTKLKAFGLDPSEEAMTAFGNTAAAMGKDLNQMIEAVADAATGEFERLKEFGIKSKQQGDQVSFTFQGVTTTVKKESKAIQGFLMDIGNNQFGGAMSDQMDTMSGALSNFRGSFTLFQDELMNNGPFAIFKGLVNSASEILFGTKGSLSSNAAKAGKSITLFIQQVTIGFARFTDDMKKYIDAIWGSVSSLWSEFLKLPSEVQSIGIVGVMLGGFKLKAFTVGVLGSISTIKKMLGMSNIDDAMLGSLEKINTEILRIETSQARLMDANAFGGDTLNNLTAQLQILYDAKLALRGLSTAGEPLKPMSQLSGQIPVNQDAGDNERAAINFFNLITSMQSELVVTEEKAAVKKVHIASASMGEISALHRNAQQEMSDASAHFEERNAELHAAAMARKSEAFNVFKGHFNEGWTEMEENAMPVLERMSDKLLSIFGPGGSFSQGIGDATANMIIFGKSGSDSMKMLGRTIMGQVVSSLVAMGVQTALNFAKERLFGAAGTAAAITQGGLIAAAYAPAAAAVSLATLGANAVSANVGMASSFALAKALSVTGARELGGPVQRSGTYLVGERGPELFTPGQSGSITSNRDMSAGNTANVTFNINAIDTSDATRLLVSQRGTIIGVINQALNESGRASIV